MNWPLYWTAIMKRQLSLKLTSIYQLIFVTTFIYGHELKVTKKLRSWIQAEINLLGRLSGCHHEEIRHPE